MTAGAVFGNMIDACKTEPTIDQTKHILLQLSISPIYGQKVVDENEAGRNKTLLLNSVNDHMSGRGAGLPPPVHSHGSKKIRSSR